MEYRLQSMNNHMVGRAASVVSPFYSILLGLNKLDPYTLSPFNLINIKDIWKSIAGGVKKNVLQRSVTIKNWGVRLSFLQGLTLSPLGYLKTRIRWGGGQFYPPPSKSHVLCPNMTNDTSLESSCALLLESAKKIANLRKLNFLSQNPVL